jgi:predicted RNase H-like HicB family nuclease
LALKYPVTLRELSVEEGGGFLATIPLLGEKTFVADGATPAEAMAALDDLRQELIPQLLAEGIALPEPGMADPAERYSGSLMLRVSKGMHARLVASAKRNGVSLNKFATEVLAEGLGGRSMIDGFLEEARDLVAELRNHSPRTSAMPANDLFPRATWNTRLELAPSLAEDDRLEISDHKAA